MVEVKCTIFIRVFFYLYLYHTENQRCYQIYSNILIINLPFIQLGVWKIIGIFNISEEVSGSNNIFIIVTHLNFTGVQDVATHRKVSQNRFDRNSGRFSRNTECAMNSYSTMRWVVKDLNDMHLKLCIKSRFCYGTFLV